MKTTANELTEGEVRYISLVNRGANRDPFRILKGENGMIDLGKIFGRKSDQKSGVAFIAVSKNIELEQAKAYAAKAGFDTETLVEQEGGNCFVQPGFDATDRVVIYRVNDDVMVGLATPKLEAIQKGYETYNWQSTDFKEILGSSQTMPMFCIAKEALCVAFDNALYKSDDAQEFATSVRSMLADFSAHVMDVVTNVPVAAFKLEDAIHKALTEKSGDQAKPDDAEPKEPEAKETDAKAEEPEATSEDEEADSTVNDQKSEDDADADAEDDQEKVEDDKGMGGDCGPGMKGKKKPGTKGGMKPEMDDDGMKPDAKPGKKKPGMKDGEEVTETKSDEPKADDEQVPAWATAILKSVEDVKATVASVSTEVTEVKKQVAGVTADLSETKASIVKMDAELGTNVIGGDASDDETKTRSVKSAGGQPAADDDDDDGFINFDTAYGVPFED